MQCSAHAVTRPRRLVRSHGADFHYTMNGRMKIRAIVPYVRTSTYVLRVLELPTFVDHRGQCQPQHQQFRISSALSDTVIYRRYLPIYPVIPLSPQVLPCLRQWGRQRSKGTRSFRGQKILQPGHPDARFSSKKSLRPFFSCRPHNTGRQCRFTVKIKQIKR